MSMKLKIIESFIDGTRIPEKKNIAKMNKFLKTKIKLQKKIDTFSFF